MAYMIRELRDFTGMTQKAFAEYYGIPLSTLRKWEQGEASPAPYIVNLLAGTIPGADTALIRIEAGENETYFYDKNKKTISDSLGNSIRVKENLEEIKPGNLIIYLQDLFAGFYEIQRKFNRDCEYDKKEDILWSR